MRRGVGAIALGAAAAFAAVGAACAEQRTVRRSAHETLTPCELDRGERLVFTLADGRERTLELLDVVVRVLVSNVPEPRVAVPHGQTLYEFAADVRIDGHPMTLRRFVPARQSFCEPLVVGGMRVWLDAVRELGERFNENHGDCLPTRAARFVVQDATLPIAPQPLRPWWPCPENRLDVGQCYEGNDVFLGPYRGADLHGGLDVNMPIGTLLAAPIDFDDHHLFNSVAAGDNNNRWRGVRRWPNGDVWWLQTHHVVELLTPPGRPLPRGKPYAVAAGVWTGSRAHTHFAFRVETRGETHWLDPWIVLRELLQTNRRRAGEPIARVATKGVGRAGRPVRFDGSDSSPGVNGLGLTHAWDFGDGCGASGPKVEHRFVTPGVHRVTLTIDDGGRQRAATHHVIINAPEPGPDADRLATTAALRLDSADDPSFRPPPPGWTAIDGDPPRVTRVLRFLARPKGSPRPAPKRLRARRAGPAELPRATFSVEFLRGHGWLRLAPGRDGSGDFVDLRVDAEGLKPRSGVYTARVRCDAPGALNSGQSVLVRLRTLREPPPTRTTIDEADPACDAPAWCWPAPRFPRPWPGGHGEGYAFGSPGAVAPAVFRPDLAPGVYDVSLCDEAPATIRGVRKRLLVAGRLIDADGERDFAARPTEGRTLGVLRIVAPGDARVEIDPAPGDGGRSARSRWVRMLDAIRFEPATADALSALNRAPPTPRRPSAFLPEDLDEPRLSRSP